jgi:hypothetical protein
MRLTYRNAAALEKLDSELPSEAELHERWIETSNSELSYWMENTETLDYDQPIAGPSNTSPSNIETTVSVSEEAADHFMQPDGQSSNEQLTRAPLLVSPPRGFARRPTRLNPWE